MFLAKSQSGMLFSTLAPDLSKSLAEELVELGGIR
jgi:hypothetical protein